VDEWAGEVLDAFAGNQKAFELYAQLLWQMADMRRERNELRAENEKLKARGEDGDQYRNMYRKCHRQFLKAVELAGRYAHALKPFAKWAEGWNKNWPDDLPINETKTDECPTLGDCRRALETLRTPTEESGK
jgi:hypothetical protein